MLYCVHSSTYLIHSVHVACYEIILFNNFKFVAEKPSEESKVYVSILYLYHSKPSFQALTFISTSSLNIRNTT